MTESFLPARSNPLRLDRSTNLPYLFDSGDWNDHLERLGQLKYCAAIVGPCGTGKSTLLRCLKRQFASRGVPNYLLDLPREKIDHPRLIESARNAARQSCILLVDGIERVSFWQRRRLMKVGRRHQGLIVTVHRRSRLPTWIRCRPSKQLLGEMLNRLGLDEPEIQSEAHAAYDHYSGNIRSVMRHLYDQFASCQLSVT